MKFVRQTKLLAAVNLTSIHLTAVFASMRAAKSGLSRSKG